ncbi:hypothetical protein GALMADRAFT_156959 [Galerina marginata CBS 339.88]|uniref:Zinc-finger domain-containing protein n=1 Tax=Galerina marginata (strain CBS 339.88) TaxID=685588 RepID=A0A067SW11_GALM3|nr:hypothetical protein GALMADRAFT_156959 [Galerina marginata CBS 339.88]
MSATPKSHPAVQRLNKAYVQVPASPLSLTSYRALGTPNHVASSSRLKENTPLRAAQLAMMQHASSSSAFLKRKLSDREPSSLIFDGVNPSAKKSKLSTGATIGALMPTQIKPLLPAGNASPEFPNGFAYCHQCNKKRDITATVRCTVVEKYQTTKDKNTKERLCANKYCKSCLKNRYNEDIETLKSEVPGSPDFKCPRCLGNCNCPRCRKSKGLEPIGYLPKKPKESVPAPKIPKKLKVEVVIGPKLTVVPKSRPKPKDLPLLTWNPVPVSLDQSQADDRIFIREFALRFSDLLDPVIAKTHLEELEFIGGRPRKHDEEGDPLNWVSEACIRALTMGLLGFLAKDHETHISQMIKAAVKELRSSGVNLNRIWSVLASLRDDIANVSSSEGSTTSSLSDIEPPLSFPDPLPPPASDAVKARSLRNLRQSDNLVNVAHSVQMIPVLVSLIHSVLETAILREDLDQSMKDSKDFIRDAREATRIENERWDKERSAIEGSMDAKDKAQKEELKVKRIAHRDQISNIDNSLKIISRSFVPRFTTLGTDDGGRTYYALSPSPAEREAAFEYLEVASSEKAAKPKKKGRILSSEGRREMREWSWFVAVWGKKPPLSSEEQKANVARKMEVDGGDADDNEDDADVEKWWGFWEPEGIVKVAEWISIKSGLEDDREIPDVLPGSSSVRKTSTASNEKTNTRLPPRVEYLKRLVTELKDYAALLQWRVREDKSTVLSRTPASVQTNQVQIDSKGKGKLSIGAVPVDRFYQ